nr:EOG090X0D3U [Eulimnadia texana]
MAESDKLCDNNDTSKENLETPDSRQEETAAAEESGNSHDPKPISKREQKRRAKAALWAERKAEKRLREKEKRKLKRKNGDSSERVSRKILKATTMANSSCKVSVVIDLSFDDYMSEKDLAKCIKQVHRSYSINRRATNPVQFHITSLNGRSLQEIKKNQGYINWDVNREEKHYSEIFDPSRIVYLTSESDNIIQDLSDDKVYVIGGLVDHNSQKGLCHQLALERGVSHGRLPLDEHVDMKTRKVLTIDHVFNILVNVSNGQTWKEAFLQVLPARKGAVERTTSDDDQTSA